MERVKQYFYKLTPSKPMRRFFGYKSPGTVGMEDESPGGTRKKLKPTPTGFKWVLMGLNC